MDCELSIILASASPRRKELLAEAGYKFKVFPAEIDESAFSDEGITTVTYAQKLALAKAEKVADKFPDHLIIGADTVVDFNGQIIGKPTNASDAERITRKLFSLSLVPHKVITAIAIVRLSDRIKFVNSDTTLVYVKPMSEIQIAEHIKQSHWQGKAGAYAIKAKGDQFVETVDGSMSNVMGLPMELLHRMLGQIFDGRDRQKQ